jgi:hypothetical protein
MICFPGLKSLSRLFELADEPRAVRRRGALTDASSVITRINSEKTTTKASNMVRP